MLPNPAFLKPSQKDRFAALLIFGFSFLLRRFFFCGFILGDDCEEFSLMQDLLARGPVFEGHLQYRFVIWVFNWICFALFGVSEATFFLPTQILSASLGVIAYFLFLKWHYERKTAFLSGLLVASFPFEVLIGTVRANDLFLSWFLAVGLWCFFALEKKPLAQGMSLGVFMWLGFYTKLWAVYFLPVLGLYYGLQFFRYRIGAGLAGFCGMSLALHALSSLFWALKTGTFFPFLLKYSATYPVPAKDLAFFFKQYPTMLFQGSEFGTTFFGYMPWMLLALLGMKTVAAFMPTAPAGLRWDRVDRVLFACYVSFFLLLNFFTNNFKFDQYYSAPRIFRYLAPLSFPMSVHTAKILADCLRAALPPMKIRISGAAVLVFLVFFTVNLVQTFDATQPGRIYRRTLLLILKDVKKYDPPQVLAESWLSFFLEQVYLKGSKGEIAHLLGLANAKDYEKWLKSHEAALRPGSLLISGLGSYVHYGAHYTGFRLNQFESGLSRQWKMIKEYETQSYLPVPEKAKLWQWTGGREDGSSFSGVTAK